MKKDKEYERAKEKKSDYERIKGKRTTLVMNLKRKMQKGNSYK